MIPSVIAVFDPNYGTRLRALSVRAPIWIVQSAENNPVVEQLRSAGQDITTFLPGTLLDWMSTIDEHHPGWRTLEVHGHELSPEVIEMLRDYGDGKYDTALDHFRFSRSVGGEP